MAPSLVQAQLDSWGYVPRVVTSVFGTTDGASVERCIDDFCASVLGSGVAVHELFTAGVGSVHGVQLRDGRRLVVKAVPGTFAPAFLGGVHEVQSALAARGFPCPTPLHGPEPLGRGTAVVESLLADGVPGDPHEPRLRRALAAALARLIEVCRDLPVPPALDVPPLAQAPGAVWGEPHDARFDFDATAAGAEWIDELAVRARHARRGDRPRVLGHHDWRAENVRFAGGRVSAVYDWDSLRLLPEPELVGGAASQFTSDYRVRDRRQRPTLAEMQAFVADYESARAAPFDAGERAEVRATIVEATAYGGRCEHSDALTDFGRRPPAPLPAEPPPPGSARAFLRAHAEELLGGV
jgi:hypothetical protein